MSRRSILSVSERDSLLVIPENQDDLIRYYTFNEPDLSLIRQRQVMLPVLTVIERACAEAITHANRRIYRVLIEPLTEQHRCSLDDLLKRKPNNNTTWLIWLRQSPLKPNSRHMLEHIERLKTFQKLALPEGIGRYIHQNRLLKLAREGGQMTPQDLSKFEKERRYAALVALALEGIALFITCKASSVVMFNPICSASSITVTK